MVDVRRALPSLPLSVLVGAGALYRATEAGLAPPVTAVLGGVALVVAGALGHHAAAGWSERQRRQIGYACAVVVGLGVGAVCGFVAFGTSLCGIWGETCTDAERAAIGRWALAAVVSPVAAPLLYGVADLVTSPWRRP